MKNLHTLWNAKQEHLDLFLDIEASMTPEQKAEAMKPIDFEAELKQSFQETIDQLKAEPFDRVAFYHSLPVMVVNPYRISPITT